MSTPYDRFDSAAGAAACETLRVIGSTLVSVGTVSFVTGVGGGLLLPGMAALLAEKYACTWDPSEPGPPLEPTVDTIDCYETVDGYLIYQYQNGSQARGPLRVKKLYSITYTGQSGDDGEFENFTIDYEQQSGGRIQSGNWLQGTRSDGGITYTIGSVPSGPNQDCLDPAPDKPLIPDLPEVTYTDPESGCVINVTVQGVAVGQAGTPEFVYKMTPGAELRADGGVIGGCNFDPVIYTRNPDGPGEPPYVGPWLPEWDDGPPGGFPWLDTLRKLAAGVAGNILADVIQGLVEAPWAGVEYRIDPSCTGADPAELPVVVEIPPLKGQDAIITRLDALVPLLQAQKDLKQPICNERPVREGEWRTISFRSEETSPFGSGRLRKRFRYLSVSGIGLEQLVDYWAGFSFEAGPVIVSHIGASWGEPKVWASTADEGKRVIRHAGGEAGLDPDQVGKWQVSSSRNPRFGVSGTMNVDTTGGYFWITARDGSSERPIVAKT